MNKNERIEIANNLVKIAKELQAGGGSGVDMKIIETDGFECYFVKAVHNENGFEITEMTKKPESSFKIKKFDALGYDDGMRDVNGEKVFKKASIDSNAIKEHLIKQLEDCFENLDEVYLDDLYDMMEEGITVKVVVADGHASTSTMFGGFQKPVLTEGSTIEFKNTISISSDEDTAELLSGDYDDAKIVGVLNSFGEKWYVDVFKSYNQTEDTYNQYR